MRLFLSLSVLSCISTMCFGETPTAPPKQTAVFVCEHGSAKSVIAAADFNRIAESKGLPYRAVSRGVHPDAEVPENIKSGLLSDGFSDKPAKPKLIADDDFSSAFRIVTLGCALPDGSSSLADHKEDWANLPAMSDGYRQARKAIVERVEKLVEDLSDKQTLQK